MQTERGKGSRFETVKELQDQLIAKERKFEVLHVRTFHRDVIMDLACSSAFMRPKWMRFEYIFAIIWSSQSGVVVNTYALSAHLLYNSIRNLQAMIEVKDKLARECEHLKAKVSEWLVGMLAI